MKVPKPQKTASGYRIQLRLGGKSIPVTASTAKECKHQAELIKSQYLAESKLPDRSTITLGQALESYIVSKSGSLSPSTIRGYRIIQRNRFKTLHDRPITSITPKEWQSAVSQEARLCSPKTLKNAVSVLDSAAKLSCGNGLPNAKLPGQIRHDTAYFNADQIKTFVKAVTPTKYAVPLLLALSSLRISEVFALRWEDIPSNSKIIHVRGAAVPDEHSKLVRKEQNKNMSSSRDVPIFIPELSLVLERDRQPQGCVSPVQEWALRKALRRICSENDLPNVTVHGLRHSFASLCHHLQIPEREAMAIGGWSDPKTMRNIYTHIAQSDIESYSSKIMDFYRESM